MSVKTIKLPKQMDPKDYHKWELELMKTSLEMSGIETSSNEELLQKTSERNEKENLCLSNRPPLPFDYLANKPQISYIGHGFYYKSGLGTLEMHKDNAWEDFDSLDNFVRLTRCKVLVANYEEIIKDFDLPPNTPRSEIDDFLIQNFCYVSTGQISRMTLPDGNLSSLVDPDWVKCIDLSDRKMGIRQRGGGRAATFFVNDQFEMSSPRQFSNNTLLADVKGCGTIDLQKKVPRKASGFLSYADALKGFMYERAMNFALKKFGGGESSNNWSTVKNYAIVDIGIRWKKENPATGIEGDVQNVYLIRAPHSRYSCKDEMVYYSVIQMPELGGTDQGKKLIETLRKAGVSSEQIPFSPSPSSWNVQGVASFDKLVDFSHWYFIPQEYCCFMEEESKECLKGFRMSKQMFDKTVMAQGKMVFGKEDEEEVEEVMKKVYGTTDREEAEKIFESKKLELEREMKEVGKVGCSKPDLSWSWMCECDDSEAMKFLLEVSCGQDEEKRKFDFEVIKKWLK